MALYNAKLSGFILSRPFFKLLSKIIHNWLIKINNLMLLTCYHNRGSCLASSRAFTSEME
ncbi:hypothetical protein FACS1894172_03140 [Spirochaetia bacterium]|nr:hypothetical protein FACS1894172_03140 [Spirochaetia bacterium]